MCTIFYMITECMSILFSFLSFFSVRKKSDPLVPTSFDPGTSRIQILNPTTEPQNFLGPCGLKLLVVSEVCLGTYLYVTLQEKKLV